MPSKRRRTLITLKSTDLFDEWFKHLKDYSAKQKIAVRLDRVVYGNFGDHKRLNEYLWELRIREGKGYRVYYTLIGDTVCFLLAGGHKGTQSKDIKLATQIAEDLIKEHINECH